MGKSQGKDLVCLDVCLCVAELYVTLIHTVFLCSTVIERLGFLIL